MFDFLISLQYMPKPSWGASRWVGSGEVLTDEA